MKGTTWEGGYRVPCIARWPGKLPAGRTSDALGITLDLFATDARRRRAEAAAGATACSTAAICCRASGQGRQPARGDLRPSGRQDRLACATPAGSCTWCLPRTARRSRPGEKWIDPRGPDGVTILAPYEQSQPSDYPGLRTGDPTKALSLFDLVNDPGEQRDVSAQNPEVVARLRAALRIVPARLARGVRVR